MAEWEVIRAFGMVTVARRNEQGVVVAQYGYAGRAGYVKRVERQRPGSGPPWVRVRHLPPDALAALKEAIDA